MSPTNSLRYEQTGVDYDTLDAFKRACQRAAAATTGALAAHGLREPAGVRGESAYLLETADAFWAHVEEGLGTKNLVADAVEKATGRGFYRAIGIDTVATIVNDMITCGALPVSVAMHVAAGDAAWFADPRRGRDLAEGFAQACIEAGAAWGGGETPVLKGIVEPGALVLAGSAVGRVAPKSHRITGEVGDNDAIVLLASSGVHTNGLTLCRAVAAKLEQGYVTPMADGRSYGEALLEPSVIYVRFVAECQRRGIGLHYAAHVTGHGWRKLMRLEAPAVYRITDTGAMPEIFRFIMEHGPVDLREAYATFNMGAGFAAYVAADDAQRAVRCAAECGYRAWVAGRVEKQGDRKAVEIEPLGITFQAQTLQVR